MSNIPSAQIASKGSGGRVWGRCVRSWLQKMQVVKRVLVDEAPSQRPQLDDLANAFIYLQVSFA